MLVDTPPADLRTGRELSANGAAWIGVRRRLEAVSEEHERDGRHRHQRRSVHEDAESGAATIAVLPLCAGIWERHDQAGTRRQYADESGGEANHEFIPVDVPKVGAISRRPLD